MKYYICGSVVMGWNGERYIPFETEDEYILWYRENVGDN